MFEIIIELFKISFFLGLTVAAFIFGANLLQFVINIFCDIIVNVIAFIGKVIR
jgi:hypothetical protein